MKKHPIMCAIAMVLLAGGMVLGYYHLPWSVREPIYRRAPQLDRALRHSGLRILDRWDTLALFGRDAAVELDGFVRGEQVYGGFPAGPATLLQNRAYSVGYSDALRNPLWSAYRIFDGPPASSGDRPAFKTDTRTRAKVKHRDFTHSGFDRGHLAPNHGIATRYGRAAQVETFLLSNIIPQTPRVNRYLWRELERRVADRYSDCFGEVWVVCGPVFEAPVERLDSGVAVPSHYYKIIAAEHNGRLRVMAFLVGRKIPPYSRLRKCLVSVDEIERRTGLDFFPALPASAQNALEAAPAGRLWPTLFFGRKR